jgi:hypothetical protein
MTASDDFTKLKEQVETADRSIRDAAARGTDELKAMVEQARQNADTYAAELRSKSQARADEDNRHWQEVESDWARHVKRIRERIDSKKAEHDANVAELDAEWAEADAIAAVECASAAIEEAQYAVLDAVLARKDADVMAAAAAS